MSRRVCSPPYTGGRHRPLHSLWRCTRVLRTRLRSSIVPGGQKEQVHSLPVRPQPSKRRAKARTLACAYRTPRLPTLPLHKAVWPRTRNSAEARVCARREGVACPFSLRQNFTAQRKPSLTWATLLTVKRILSLRDGCSHRVSPGPAWPHAPCPPKARRHGFCPDRRLGCPCMTPRGVPCITRARHKTCTLAQCRALSMHAPHARSRCTCLHGEAPLNRVRGKNAPRGIRPPEEGPIAVHRRITRGSARALRVTWHSPSAVRRKECASRPGLKKGLSTLLALRASRLLVLGRLLRHGGAFPSALAGGRHERGDGGAETGWQALLLL